MKRTKRTLSQDERTLVFDLCKQGVGFSDIGRIIEAKSGSIFTILRVDSGIQPRPRHRNISHLSLSEREEIHASLSAKMSIRATAKQLSRSRSTISREKRMAKRPKLGVLGQYPELKSCL